MEYPTIIIQRTKEDLRKYKIFSSIKRKSFRRIVYYMSPVFGVPLLILFLFYYRAFLFFIVGTFLIVYPLMIRFSISKLSDSSYEVNKIGEQKIKVSFLKDSFTLSIQDKSNEFAYSLLKDIYNTEDEIVLFLQGQGGLYISKHKYEDEVIDQIITVLQSAAAEKFVKVKSSKKS